MAPNGTPYLKRLSTFLYFCSHFTKNSNTIKNSVFSEIFLNLNNPELTIQQVTKNQNKAKIFSLNIYFEIFFLLRPKINLYFKHVFTVCKLFRQKGLKNKTKTRSLLDQNRMKNKCRKGENMQTEISKYYEKQKMLRGIKGVNSKMLN